MAPAELHEPEDRDLEAIIKAGGLGERLGMGPKAFVRLGTQTLVERAVETMLAITTRVLVAVPAGAVEDAERSFGPRGVRVIEGGPTRSDTHRRLVEASEGPWLIQHDVAHPFVTPGLARRVVVEARRCGAAAAGRWNTEMLFDANVRHRAGPDEFVAPTMPFVFRRADAIRSLAMIDRLPSDRRHDPGSVELLRLVHDSFSFVPAPPWNIKLTWPDDLVMAEALLRSGLPLDP
jgi:2-C-methyl-D-erythritol 4-phosphate cytidylyltransferase